MSELGPVQSSQSSVAKCGTWSAYLSIRLRDVARLHEPVRNSEDEPTSTAAQHCLVMSRWLKASAKEEGSTGSKAVTWKRTVFAGCNRTTDVLFQQPKCAVIDAHVAHVGAVQCRASSIPAVHWASWMVRRRRITPGTTRGDRGDQCESWIKLDYDCRLDAPLPAGSLSQWLLMLLWSSLLNLHYRSS